jgi:hypothetical protein
VAARGARGAPRYAIRSSSVARALCTRDDLNRWDAPRWPPSPRFVLLSLVSLLEPPLFPPAPADLLCLEAGLVLAPPLRRDRHVSSHLHEIVPW